MPLFNTRVVVCCPAQAESEGGDAGGPLDIGVEAFLPFTEVVELAAPDADPLDFGEDVDPEAEPEA